MASDATPSSPSGPASALPDLHWASLDRITVDWPHLTVTIDLTATDFDAREDDQPPFRPVQLVAHGLRELRLPPRRIWAASTTVESAVVRPGPDDPWGPELDRENPWGPMQTLTIRLESGDDLILVAQAIEATAV